MPNTNILEGMQCPQCGALEPFHIEIKTVVVMWDSGSEANGDECWDDDSYCSCQACLRSGTVRDFRKEGADDA